MNRTIARRAAFAVAALLLCAAFVPTATAGDIAPRLERALASPAFPWLAGLTALGFGGWLVGLWLA